MFTFRKYDSIDETDEDFKNDLEEHLEEELFLLYKDGVLYNDVTVESLENGFFYVTPTTIEMGEKLLNFNISQFPGNTILTIELKDVWDDFVPTLKIQLRQDHYYEYTKTNDVREVQIIISPNFDDWKFPFNYLDYRKIFNSIVLSDLSKNAEEVEELSFLSEDVEVFSRVNQRDFTFVGNNNSVTVAFIHKFGFESIFYEVLKHIKISKQLHEETIQHLELEDYRKKIIATFTFPNKLKNQCEQYLIYFSEFLKDLGINATSNLKEQVGKVLFSVTPTDDVEALDKIREALAIYLSLPSNPIPNSTGDRTVDMVLSGARANAKHLESQLELAIAKLQFKEATLELKDATIEQHQLTLRRKDETIKELQEIVARGNIFEESLERVEINGEVVDESSLYRFSRADDIEVEATPILDEKTEETKIGLVKFHEVTKLKDYGVSLDLPKAIRDLIDYFKRDKNK